MPDRSSRQFVRLASLDQVEFLSVHDLQQGFLDIETYLRGPDAVLNFILQRSQEP